MRTLARYAIFLTLIGITCVICAVAQTERKPTRKTPGGQISGSVTIHGKPAPGVVVAIWSNRFNPGASPLLKATTSEDGKYHIPGVTAGTHFVAPIASAFIPSETSMYGRRGRTVVIEEDERVDEIDFTLVRGGVITGKVIDANGRPVMEEHVNLDPFQPDNSQPVITDDRGIYRIFGLPPGKFKVYVGQGDDAFGSGRSGSTTYRKTFFPDATDPAKARVVELTEGAEQTNIDITVRQTFEGFSAKGRVVNADTGRPVPEMTIDLTRTIIDKNSSSSIGGTAARSNRQGEFTIENLVPGKYSISISPLPDSNLRADPVAFEVVDQNLSGLLIKTSVGASLSGRVVIEGRHDDSAAAKLGQSYLHALVSSEGANQGSDGFSQIKPDGSFLISGLQAGTADLSLVGDQGKLFSILRIERDGALQANGIPIQNSEHLMGISVIVAYATASIRGLVKPQNGKLPEGVRFFINLTKPPETSSNGRSVVDSRGHFVIEGLVAGSYELQIGAYAPGPPQWSGYAKQLVTVTEGVATEVNVPIDLKQNPAPSPGP
jgi:hypothetical protein